MDKKKLTHKKFVLGIIPARGGSKGIPRKNIRKLGSVPLVAHTINQAKKSKLLSDFIVSSEDKEIRKVSERYGAKTMDRPKKYSHDKILQEVDLLLEWTVKKYEKINNINVDIVVLLYPTAPLRDVASIDKCIDLVKLGKYDSAISVYFDTRYLWKKVKNKTILPTNYNPNQRMPRQKENWNQYAENKAIYVMTKKVLLKYGRIGKKCGYVEMEKWRSIDIDTFQDLKIAKAFFQKK